MIARTHSGTRWGGAYFALQAVAVAAWWTLLFARPEWRAHFVPAGSLERDLLAFWLPDLAFGVVGSMAAAIVFLAGSAWVVPASWLVAGGMGYAAAYCVSQSLATDSAWWSVVFMVPAALMSTVFAVDVSAPIVGVFRRAASTSAAGNLAATAFQTLLFWTFFLLVAPAGIAAVETRLGLPTFGFPGQVALAVACFVVCSALGVTSGITMARIGRGTPLPLASPNRLVVAGPYAYVRNPMAIAGLGQGLAVGLGLGSWAVLAYVVAGGAIWDALVRPAEERDLADTFGPAYERYTREVRCWFPRTTPYRPTSRTDHEF